MSALKAFGQFWYDFVIGDDWKIAAAVSVCLVLGAVVVLTGAVAPAVLVPALGVLLMVAFVVALLVDVRRSSR